MNLLKTAALALALGVAATSAHAANIVQTAAAAGQFNTLIAAAKAAGLAPALSGLQDGEHQFLLAHRTGVLDIHTFGKSNQIGWRFRFEVLEFHLIHLGLSMPVIKSLTGKSYKGLF